MAGRLLSGDRQVSCRRLLTFAILISTALLLVYASSHYTSQYRSQRQQWLGRPLQVSDKTLPTLYLTKPKDVAIVGLVFFGRRSRVEVLRCYVERNLVDNGGWLDEIHWVRNTQLRDDLDYLQEILNTSQRHKVVDVPHAEAGFAGFNNAWTHMERGKLYVKIDDDVMWMADDTIPRLVTTKIAHPEYLLVSANMINSPLMGWVHYHMGAMQPYLPEYKGVMDLHSSNDHRVKPILSRKAWRYTEYPSWEGPDEWSFGLDQDPPYNGHRWLRLQNDSDLHRTPVTQIEYGTWGTGLKSWTIAAQQHYSFLENLLEDRLHLYKFDRTWLTDYDRLSINLIAVWADEVLDNLPMDVVDEEWLTRVLPQRIGKSVAVESKALGAHLSFSFQNEGVQLTDILSRYKDYAEVSVCHHYMMGT